MTCNLRVSAKVLFQRGLTLPILFFSPHFFPFQRQMR